MSWTTPYHAWGISSGTVIFFFVEPLSQCCNNSGTIWTPPLGTISSSFPTVTVLPASLSSTVSFNRKWRTRNQYWDLQCLNENCNRKNMKHWDCIYKVPNPLVHSVRTTNTGIFNSLSLLLSSCTGPWMAG